MDIVHYLIDKPASAVALAGAETDRLIAVLGDFGAAADTLKTRFSAAHDVPDLLGAVAAGLGDDAVKAAFADAGQSDLYDRLLPLANRIRALPPEASMLLKPLSSFVEVATGTDPAHQNWSVGADPGRIGWSANGDFLTPRLAAASPVAGGFTVGGSIALDCEAGSLWFYAKDAVPAQGLVRIGFSGGLTASATAQVPLGGLGSGSVDAAASGTCNVHLFWRRPETQLYATALADIVRRPVDILDLADIWDAASIHGLQGVVLALDGRATVDVKVGIAREFDVEGLFSGTAGLTVSVDLTRSAAYELSLLWQGSSLRVVLSHADSDVDKWAAGLGLDVDASGLFARVGALLVEATAQWDVVLEDIKPFLTPGTWLRTDAAGALADLSKTLLGATSPAATALQSDLRLLLGAEQGETSALADLLSTLVVGRIDALEKAATTDAAILSETALGALGGVLPAIGSDPALATALKTQIGTILSDFQAKFAATVDAIAAKPGTAVAEALLKLGQALPTDTIDAKAAGIRALVGKVDDTLKRLVAATADTAKAKIAARLSFEKSRVENEAFELSARFTNTGDGARALFRSLMLGNMKGLPDIVAGVRSVDGFVVDTAGSSIRRFAEVSSTIGYELVLLGLDFTGKAVATGNADVTLSGDQITVNATASAATSAKGISQQRQATFVEAFSLLLAKVEANGPRPSELQRGLTLDLSTQRTDEVLEVKEIEQFLDTVVHMNLISSARSGAMQDYLRARTKTRGTDRLSGTVILSFALSQAEIARLMTLGAPIDRNTADRDVGDAARHIFMAALQAMFDTGEWDTGAFADWVMTHTAARSVDGATKLDRAKERLFERRWEPFQVVTFGTRSPMVTRSDNGEEGDRRRALNGLITIVAQMAAISTSVPRLSGSGSGWTVADYANAQGKIADAARQWLVLNRDLLVFFRPGIHRRLIALMLALLELAEVSPVNGAFDRYFRLSLALEGEALPATF